MNYVRTGMLMAGLTALFLAVGYLLGGSGGMLLALVFAAVWLIVAIVLRYSSLAALTAAIAVPVALWFQASPQVAALFAVMSVIVFIKHRANISRLLAGTEGRIGAKG